jgi:hypothetical protein
LVFRIQQILFFAGGVTLPLKLFPEKLESLERLRKKGRGFKRKTAGKGWLLGIKKPDRLGQVYGGEYRSE